MTEKTVQADLELKKGFAELQAKVQDSASKIRIADGQIETLRREKAHAELTKKEISALNPKTPTYEALGRLFIFRDVDTIKQHLDDRVGKAEAKMKACENSKLILERSVKESENNMRELVQQWKNK